MKQLPPTGTAALLEVISPYIPDDLINSLFAEKAGRGRPPLFSAAQLFRINLLALLTPAHPSIWWRHYWPNTDRGETSRVCVTDEQYPTPKCFINFVRDWTSTNCAALIAIC